MDKTVQELQDEVKVLKNEIKETLTDIREHLLTYAENPFATTPVRPAPAPTNGHNGSAQAPVPGGQSTVVSVSGGHDSSPAPAVGTEKQPEDAPKPAAAASEAAPPPQPADKQGSAPKADAPAPSPNGKSKEPVPNLEAIDRTETPTREEDGEAVSSPSSVAEAMDRVQEAAMVEEECFERQPTLGRPAPSKARPAPRGEVKELFIVATLTPWMEDNVSRLGKDRVKAIVEVYASMGGICDGLRDVLLKLISLDGASGVRPNASLRECMRALAELDNLLYRSRQDPRGAALYAALLNCKEVTGVPWGRE